MNIEEKKKFLREAALVWDKLDERSKGRLEGKIEAYKELINNEKKSA